jgi:metallo-beta-lactamase family protein
MATTLSIAFEGAARTVTGSRHRIRFGDRQWLFDCGLYQGHRDEAERINRAFRFEPADLDAVVLSHAHLDHIGNLPTLVKRGFTGPIHATAPTADLCGVLLPDSAHLMQKDVEHVNWRDRGKGRVPREPLYGPDDVDVTLARLVTHRYHDDWELFPGVRVRYHDAGHILGSAVTTFEFSAGGRTLRLGMGGDLGRARRPILRDPEVPAGVDVLVLESTYGDRLHSDSAADEQELIDVVERTAKRGGRVVVPAFAVGRTQELVATLHRLIEEKRLRELPIFVDSPMASKTTQVFRHHAECFDTETRSEWEEGDGAPFGFARLKYISSPQESMALNEFLQPCIIVSASGMCEGGRVLHHLRQSIGDPRNTVLFVGYQAEGTLGRRIRDGHETVNIFGEPYARRCEVQALESFSAHADQRELLEWVARLSPAPRVIHLVHGEPTAAETLAGLLRERTTARVHVPEPGETFDLWS